MFSITYRELHVINWNYELHWTADSSICKAEFVHLCLQSWIPHYQWRNVNNTVASLSQLMSIKKNSGKIEEVASQPQYMFVKEKVLHMTKFYLRKK